MSDNRTPDRPSASGTNPPDRPSSFGTSTPEWLSPFGTSTPERPSPFGTGKPDQSSPYGTGEPDSSGFAHRGAGASVASGGIPVAAEPRGGAVPQPRDPAEQPYPNDLDSGVPRAVAWPATGTARPVTGSASVPGLSRAQITPEELPPPATAPQPRVYGRATAPQTDEAQHPNAQHPNAQHQDAQHQDAQHPNAQGDHGSRESAVHDFNQRDTSPSETAPHDSAPGEDAAHHSAWGDEPGAGAWPWDRRPSQAPREQEPSAGYHAPDIHTPYQRNPEAPVPAPQSPARATGRATASARVTPPTEAPHSGPPYTEFTSDIAGRGDPAPHSTEQPQQRQLPDFYGEHTTDISGRGRPSEQQPHASPGFDGDRPSMAGAFPGDDHGPANRATVTPPPGPDETANWPGAAPADPKRGGFDQFMPDAYKAEAKPETPHVRTLPVIIGVVIVATLIVGAAIGVVYLIAGGNSGSAGLQVNVGDCVKRNGTEAVTAPCTDAGAFQVAQIADTQDQCTDPKQPYVVDPTNDSRTRVLCLKPVG